MSCRESPTFADGLGRRSSELQAPESVSLRVKRATLLVIVLLGVQPPPAQAGTGKLQGAASGLPAEVIQRVIKQNFGQFRRCYEAGLRSCPNLQGRVTVRFTILRDGSVKGARVESSDLPDKAVGTCVAHRMGELTFPTFDGKPIQVSYPISFSPGG